MLFKNARKTQSLLILRGKMSLNVIFCVQMFFKVVLFKISLFLQIVFFKSARKKQNLRILRGKLNQNVILCVQIFFKILLSKNSFFFKIVFFKNLFSSKQSFLKKNLTLFKIFNSKSDAS